MKLIKNNSYLLLIDEEAKIKEGDKVEFNCGYVYNPCIIYNDTIDKEHCKIVIAYYPLIKEAKELDLPLLPNPFKNKVSLEVEIDNLINNSLYNDFSFREKAGFRVGYREAQSKQFSLEDVKKAIEMAREYEFIQFGGGDTESKYTEEEIIQSLSTKHLPKEFIPEYEKVLASGEWFTNHLHGSDELRMLDKKFYVDDVCYKVKGIEHPGGNSYIRTDVPYKSFVWNYQNNRTIFVDSDKLKTIINSEGKQVLVGTYKY